MHSAYRFDLLCQTLNQVWLHQFFISCFFWSSTWAHILVYCLYDPFCTIFCLDRFLYLLRILLKMHIWQCTPHSIHRENHGPLTTCLCGPMAMRLPSMMELLLACLQDPLPSYRVFHGWISVVYKTIFNKMATDKYGMHSITLHSKNDFPQNSNLSIPVGLLAWNIYLIYETH